ncbi:MAG: TonB-dependent receptor [Haliscomenobacter sp.]|nr:TonB-dependent receptor [Haliscomenobacter sp.]MBP9078268.1 TonB-dependent receptor [Haliscomenobacter sp.]
MKFDSRTTLLNFLLFFLLGGTLSAQNILRGVIKDVDSGEPLISATVLIKGTSEGAVTDFDGKFQLNTAQNFPITLLASYVGYKEKEVILSASGQFTTIQLEADVVSIAAIEVEGRRLSEKQTQSPITMESMDNIAIKETPAVSFYDGLGSLKEVDLTAASLGFKIINTRGFNSTSPVRSLQIIDGVDNQSPGLNFSLGNFLGASELDVNRVNLIVGASSAYYGPNAFNGVISMETKSPFLHKGLSAMVKGGERSLVETGFRYAAALKDKNGLERLAFKINFFYFQANDWPAENYTPVFDTDSGLKNPGGFDAVNIYGDEYLPSNDFTGSFAVPGLGIIHRKGYREIDLVDYDSKNLKAGAALHYRLKPAKNYQSPELILASNYSTGTTVYQGDNRFSLRDIQFFQHRIELKKNDTYFLRLYATHEDAGNSYDPYFTAIKLQEQSKSNNQWRADYLGFWQINMVPRLRKLDGFPSPLNYLGRPAEYNAAANAFFAQPMVQDSLSRWHSLTQAAAGLANPIDGTKDYFEPGTERFQQVFNDITSRISFSEGGTRFYDRSALVHGQGEYAFNDLVRSGAISDLDVRIGGNFRMYLPDSKGSILLDTFGRDINTYEYGIYGGGTLELNTRLRLSGTVRLDKNQNFDYLFSPAASMVYTPNLEQTYRLSFSSAIRNPTLTDQYLFYNVGRAILIGNLDGFNNLITIESLEQYLKTLNPGVLEYFNVAPIQPEKVKTLEAGIRRTLFDKLYADATYYFSFYTDFIGYNLGVVGSFDRTTGLPIDVQAYRVAANAKDKVTTQGFSLGLNYYFWKNYVINGNYSWNKLNTNTDDPIIPAFNTPEHKFNLGLAARDLKVNLLGKQVSNLGFNVTYKWIDSFVFEGSPQFTGLIPSYDLLDAQVNWQAKKIHTTFKLGASNILDRKIFQTYGGPTIGRLAYLSILYEWIKK